MSTKRKESTKISARQKRVSLQQQRRKIIRLSLLFTALAVAVVAALLLRSKSQAPASDANVNLDKSVGDASAPVVIVEYGDFQCPACQQFFRTSVKQLKADYVQSGSVRFVFRHFAFLGDESRWAAEASECANDQGRFWDYYDKLYQEQNGENVGVFSKDNLTKFAAELGLETSGFKQCLDSGRYTAKVQQETREGEQAGVRGTPSVFVNNQYIMNGNNYVVLQAAVKAALDSRD